MLNYFYKVTSTSYRQEDESLLVDVQGKNRLKNVRRKRWVTSVAPCNIIYAHNARGKTPPIIHETPAHLPDFDSTEQRCPSALATPNIAAGSQASDIWLTLKTRQALLLHT